MPTKKKPQVHVEKLTPLLCACGRQAVYSVLLQGVKTPMCTYHYKGMLKNYDLAPSSNAQPLDLKEHPIRLEGSNYFKSPPPEDDRASELDCLNADKKFDKFNGEVRMARWVWESVPDNRKVLVDRKNNFYVVRQKGHPESGKYLYRADGVAIARLNVKGGISSWLVSPELRSKQDRIGSELKAAKVIVEQMQSADVARQKAKELMHQSKEGLVNPLKVGDRVKRFVSRTFSFEATVAEILDADHVRITTKNNKTIDAGVTQLHRLDGTGGAVKIVKDAEETSKSGSRWALALQGRGWVVSTTSTIPGMTVLEKHRCQASAEFFPDQHTYLAQHDNLYMIALDRKGKDIVVFPAVSKMHKEYVQLVLAMKKKDINALPKLVRDVFPEFLADVKKHWSK
jgi:hypothetical protein